MGSPPPSAASQPIQGLDLETLVKDCVLLASSLFN